MKAITLWQPWATLVARGFKRYETRSWRTAYTGPLAIHAASKPVCTQAHVDELDLADICRGLLPFPAGCIVAVAQLVACHLVEKPAESFVAEQFSVWQRRMGDFTPGRFAWQLDNVVQLPEPIPCSGKQGLWDVPEAIQATILRAIGERLPPASAGRRI